MFCLDLHHELLFESDGSLAIITNRSDFRIRKGKKRLTAKVMLQIDEGKLKKAHDDLGYNTADIRHAREEKVRSFLRGLQTFHLLTLRHLIQCQT